MTLEIDVVTHLTESEKDYISDYMARAFDRHDIGSYVATGCLLIAENGISTRRILNPIDSSSGQSWTERHWQVVCAGGLFTTTQNRNVFAVRWLPGVVDKTLDLEWRSGDDANLDAWTGPTNALHQLMAPWVAEADRVYGKDGMNQHVRGNFLGCNPDYQQNGYAREANLREAEKLGVKVIFGSSRSNVPIYKRIGDRRVGTEFGIDYPIPAEFGHDWHFAWIMESGHSIGDNKL